MAPTSSVLGTTAVGPAINAGHHMATRAKRAPVHDPNEVVSHHSTTRTQAIRAAARLVDPARYSYHSFLTLCVPNIDQLGVVQEEQATKSQSGKPDRHTFWGKVEIPEQKDYHGFLTLKVGTKNRPLNTNPAKSEHTASLVVPTVAVTAPDVASGSARETPVPVCAKSLVLAQKDTTIETDRVVKRTAKQKEKRVALEDRQPSIAAGVPENIDDTNTANDLDTSRATTPGDMAPARDSNGAHESMKAVIQNLYDLQSHVHGYMPESQSRSIEKIGELAESLAHLQKLTSTTQSPNDPIHQARIAPDVIDYVDDGRNPDIYTRDFVELVQRGNSVINGKREAFKDFSVIFAEKLRKANPHMAEGIDRIMKNAGLDTHQAPPLKQTTAERPSEPGPTQQAERNVNGVPQA